LAEAAVALLPDMWERAVASEDPTETLKRVSVDLGRVLCDSPDLKVTGISKNSRTFTRIEIPFRDAAESGMFVWCSIVDQTVTVSIDGERNVFFGIRVEVVPSVPFPADPLCAIAADPLAADPHAALPRPEPLLVDTPDVPTATASRRKARFVEKIARRKFDEWIKELRSTRGADYEPTKPECDAWGKDHATTTFARQLFSERGARGPGRPQKQAPKNGHK
jgi:hypothetical protein